MLKANELRIGNLVNWGVNTVPIKSIHTESFLKDKVSVYIELNEKLPNHCLYTTEIEPIPLTEEWLLKFGFERQENNWKTLDLIFCIISWERSAGLALSFEKESIFLPHIKYIHQLQNLYFSLTGEELNIK